VQRPLATVVIGGVMVSTLLTLIIIPVFYYLVNSSATIVRKPFVRKILRKKPKTITMILLLMTLITTSPVFAQQTVTLDEAVAMSIANSPRLKSADAAIDRSRAAKGEAWDLGETTFEHARGQMEAPYRHDRMFSVTQSLGTGSVIAPFYRNALVKQQVITNTLSRELVEKEIIAETKRAWTYYLYTRSLVQMYGELNRFAEQLLGAYELRYRTGDITLLERNMTATQAASMRSKVFQAGEEHRIAAARLQWACFSDTPLVPADTALLHFDVNPAGDRLSAAYVSYFDSKVSEAEAQVKIEKSHFFPEFSVAYINKNIDPDYGLHSWMITASVPLVFHGQKSRVKQAKLNADIERFDAQANIFELNNRLEMLKTDLRRYAETVQFYQSSALNEADALIKTASLQLEHHDTDISQFIQSMNNALEIKRAYAEAMYLYHVAALEYDLYK
jgi:cobalt-zinc-cadmium resistance protein CzcA